MPRRKSITATTTAAAQYIMQQLDNTDWDGMLQAHRYCSACPVRTGPQLEDNRIEHYCMACPLRSWLLVTAEMALRASHARHTQDQAHRSPQQSDQDTTPGT